MCGIVGVIGNNLKKKHENFMMQALLVDSLRGFHSTGIARIPWATNGDVRIFKKALPAWDFLEMKTTAKLLSENMGASAYIGHNRHATRGAINNANSHPFQIDHITMVHNGSLLRTNNLPDYKQFEVDSENIAHCLATIGVHETTKLLDGAYALVWHDASDHTMHMVRNSQRPMHFATMEDEDVIIYGSEEGMLDWIASRCDLKISTFYELAPHTHAIFHLNKKGTKVSDFDLEEVESYKAPVARFPHNNKHSNQQAAANNPHIPASDKQNKRLKKQGLAVGQMVQFTATDYEPYGSPSPFGKILGYMEQDPWLEVEVHRQNVKDFVEMSSYTARVQSIRLDADPKEPPTVILESPSIVEEAGPYEYIPGPGKVLLNINEWNKLTKHGCSMCSGNVYIGDAENMSWVEKSPICPTCTKELEEDIEQEKKKVH